MNRYKIRNKKSGKKFMITGETFPSVLQPEWGEDPEVVTENIDAEIAQLQFDSEIRKERIRRIREFDVDAADDKDIKKFLKDVKASLSELLPTK